MACLPETAPETARSHAGDLGGPGRKVRLRRVISGKWLNLSGPRFCRPLNETSPDLGQDYPAGLSAACCMRPQPVPAVCHRA